VLLLLLSTTVVQVLLGLVLVLPSGSQSLDLTMRVSRACLGLYLCSAAKEHVRR
jgi:hypothetical protein